METNVQTDKKSKKSKKYEAEAVSTPVAEAPTEAVETATEEAIEKAKGAPRPRKWEYGITDEAQVVRVAEAPTVRKDIEAAWAATLENPTVAEYMAQFANKSDGRHGLRVMSRRGLIKIVHADGSKFPRQYEAKMAEATEPAAE